MRRSVLCLSLALSFFAAEAFACITLPRTVEFTDSPFSMEGLKTSAGSIYYKALDGTGVDIRCNQDKASGNLVWDIKGEDQGQPVTAQVTPGMTEVELTDTTEVPAEHTVVSLDGAPEKGSYKYLRGSITAGKKPFPKVELFCEYQDSVIKSSLKFFGADGKNLGFIEQSHDTRMRGMAGGTSPDVALDFKSTEPHPGIVDGGCGSGGSVPVEKAEVAR